MNKAFPKYQGLSLAPGRKVLEFIFIYSMMYGRSDIKHSFINLFFFKPQNVKFDSKLYKSLSVRPQGENGVCTQLPSL